MSYRVFPALQTAAFCQLRCPARAFNDRAEALSALKAEREKPVLLIWFPIRADQVTYGIVELLGKDSWPNDQQFLDQLVIIGEFIGDMLPERRKNS